MNEKVEPLGLLLNDNQTKNMQLHNFSKNLFTAMYINKRMLYIWFLPFY